MKYHHEEGVFQGGYSILLKCGMGLTMKVIPPPPEPLARGDRIVAAWRSKGEYPNNARGVRYIDGDAVEKIGVWKRKISYIRRQPTVTMDSFEAEQMAINLLRDQGFRADISTGFEDKVLGVDGWLFLEDLEKGWFWHPIDFTLRTDLDPHASGSKYDDAFERGVIPVPLTISLLRADSAEANAERMLAHINKALAQFALCGKSLLSRKEAMRREIEESLTVVSQ